MIPERIYQHSRRISAGTWSSDSTLSHVDEVLLVRSSAARPLQPRAPGGGGRHLGLADGLLLLLGSGPLGRLKLQKTRA